MFKCHYDEMKSLWISKNLFIIFNSIFGSSHLSIGYQTSYSNFKLPLTTKSETTKSGHLAIC